MMFIRIITNSGQVAYKCSQYNCHQHFRTRPQLQRHFDRQHAVDGGNRLTVQSLAARFAHFKTINTSMIGNIVHKCRQNGCRRQFRTKLELDFHRRQHRIRQTILIEKKVTLNEKYYSAIAIKQEPIDNHDNNNNNIDINKPLDLPPFIDLNNENTKWPLAIDDKLSTPKQYQSLKNNNNALVNGRGYQSFKLIKDLATKCVFLGVKQCVCNICGHKTYGPRASSRIAVHLNGRHLRRYVFRCDIDGCDKSYFNPNSLRIHKMNHLCGFGFGNGRNMDTACGNRNINTYREHILIDDIKFYRCSYYSDCQYTTSNHNTIKRHIHSHVCPYRQQTDLYGNKLAPNSIDIIGQFDTYGQKIVADGHEIYKCRFCDFISELIQGLIAHIKCRHFLINDKKQSMKPEALKLLKSRNQQNLNLFYNNNNNNNEKSKLFIDKQIDRQSDENDSSYDGNSVGDIGKKVRVKIEDQSEGGVRKYSKWLAFKCDHCSQRFDDLEVMRKHRLTHKRF